MKKFIFIMPLMAISLLASCGSQKPSVDQFTITFDANGGTLSGESSIKVDGGTLFKDITNKPDAHKDPEGAYTFNGWALVDDSQKSISDDYKITNDLTVYAIYTPKAYATVTFSEESSESVLYYNDNPCTKGVPFQIPAGVDVTLKIESSHGYFPILDGDVEIHEAQSYSFNLIEKEIIVKVVKDNTCVIKAVAENTPRGSLESYKWSEINILSKAGLADTCFEIGDTKGIKVNNENHLVRIIGFNEDYTELPEPGEDPNPNKSIGITFEFADLISDENGYSLATYWNDTNTTEGSNYSYKDSTIRKALNGTTNDINWFRYYGKDEDTPETGLNRKFATQDNYKKSILSMLPDELTKEGILKTTSKYININNGDGWKEETVNDKLFLLSPFEMGRATRSDREEAHTTTYSYYKGAEDSKRIKKQVIGSKEARTYSVNGTDLDGEYKSGTKYSYAGYNSSTDGYGAHLWFRSPDTGGGPAAWCVYNDGDLIRNTVRSYAYGVAPAFCI